MTTVNENAALNIGEIVEVSTTRFVAQCIEMPQSSIPRLYDPPDFGSFVMVTRNDSPAKISSESENILNISDDEVDPFVNTAPLSVKRSLPLTPNSIIAVVSHAKMTSLDTGRRPVARGYSNTDLLGAEQPQIFELLTTEFVCEIVAYTDENSILRRSLPPRPPRIHSPVCVCSAEDVREVTEKLHFVQRLLTLADTPVEELAAAIIRQGLSVREVNSSYLRDAGTQIAQMLGSDYDRLQRIMRAVLA